MTIQDSQVQKMAQTSPNQQMIQPCPETKTWVEVHLVDAEQQPVPGAHYKIELPDGSRMEGNLDDEGKVRFDSIIPGTCKVAFPEIDAKEWQQA
jgi:hypothetical protein